MKRKKMIILPQLNDCGGDLTKRWFVYYSVHYPKSDKLVRHKVYGELAKMTDEISRKRLAQESIQEYSQKLKSGWTPYNDDSIVKGMIRLNTIT